MLRAINSGILDRPGFIGSTLGGAAAAGRPIDLPNPELDPLVAQQARFRIEGNGPLSGRTIVPVSQGARELVAAREGVPDAVRGVLRLVELAAGGPERSSAIDLNGVALANSPRGHGANAYRAHMDDDTIFQSGLAKVPAGDRSRQVVNLGRESIAETMETKANVVAGWINVGPTASGALLSRAGVVIPGYNDAIGDNDLGQAIRVLRHEAQHVVDDTAPKLTPDGAMGLREALAEAHSTTLDSLVPARRALGLDGVVSDGALKVATAFRPYSQAEQMLAGALRTGGVDPASEAGRAIIALPSDRVAEELVTRISNASGTPEVATRRDLSAEFARVLGRRT